MPVTVRKRAGCISLLARFPMKVEEGWNASLRGYPATTAYSSLNPGIGGVDCVIAVEGVSQVVSTRLNLAQGESSVSWITPGKCAGYWKDQPGSPTEKLGEERPRPARVDTPGPKLYPNIASINFGARFARLLTTGFSDLRLRRALGANTSCSPGVPRENWQAIGSHL